MRWIGGRQSGNVEDRRGGGGMAIGGGIGSVVIALIVYLLGGDPSIVTDQMPSGSQGTSSTGQSVSPED
ncbi:MAG: neutral zinc metallopeptidase, partial [bacterium]|nr:neutral zinc metallopeptidase [Candidatus Kapabacteria bacterium]